MINVGPGPQKDVADPDVISRLKQLRTVIPDVISRLKQLRADIDINGE